MLEQEALTKKPKRISSKKTAGQVDRTAKKKEIARLDAEIEKRAKEVERLQQYEDNLSSLIGDGLEKTRRKLRKSTAPTASSTPNSDMQGQYRHVVHDILCNTP